MFLQENPVNYEEFFPREWFEEASTRAVIREKIKWAKHILKRSDRITWYLRLLRIAIASQYVDQTTYNSFIYKYNKKTKGAKIPVKDKIFSTGMNRVRVRHIFRSGAELSFQLETDLAHYLALNIPDINEYEFGWQLPHEIFSAFKGIEETYLQKFSSYIPADRAEDYRVLIDFKDGYKWFNTEEQNASDQTYAMTGHCSTCFNDDEIALVLREHVVIEGEDFWRPVLQFCVDPRGMLGEMKGRANNKPSNKYYKYIIPLLQHSIIKGIKGGGHKPHTNFALADLPDRDRKKLQKLKPALLSLQEYIKIYGLDKKVVKRLRDATDLLLVYDKKSRTWLVELDSDTTLHKLLKDIGNRTTQWLADIVYGEEFLEVYNYDTDASNWFHLLKDKTRARLEKFEETDYEEYNDVISGASICALEAGASNAAYEKLFEAIKDDVVCDFEVYFDNQAFPAGIEDVPVIIKAEWIDSPATAYTALEDLINAGFTFTTQIESVNVKLNIDENIDLDDFDESVFEERIEEELDERGF